MVSVVAGLSLALGIGANTAIFSLIDSLMLRALPGVVEPERLVTMSSGQTNDTGMSNAAEPRWSSVRPRSAGEDPHEGLEHSRVAPVFEYLTIELGPRLTASPAHKRAAEWTRDRLASYGLQNAHLEAWQFGRGWSLEKLTRK